MTKKLPVITQKQYRTEYLEQINDMSNYEARIYITNQMNDIIKHRLEGFKWEDLMTEHNWNLDIHNHLKALNKIKSKLQ